MEFIHRNKLDQYLELTKNAVTPYFVNFHCNNSEYLMSNCFS